MDGSKEEYSDSEVNEEQYDEDIDFVDANTINTKVNSMTISTESLLKELHVARKSLDQTLTHMIRSKNKGSKINRKETSQWIDNVKKIVSNASSKDEYIKTVIGTLKETNTGKMDQKTEDAIKMDDEATNPSTKPIPWRWLEKTVYTKKKPKRFNAEVLELMNKQAKKDVERDLFIINGVDVPGTIGYDNLLIAIQATVEGFDPTFNDDESFKIATDILRFASRTQSSGAAYEAMTYIFSNQRLCTFLPESQIAPPIIIDIGIGKWGDDWGLGVSLRAASVYKVAGTKALENASNDEEIQQATWFHMEAIYDQTHCLNAIEAKQTNTYNAAQLRATVAFAQFGAAGLNKKNPRNLEGDDSDDKIEEENEKDSDFDTDSNDDDDDDDDDDEDQDVIQEYDEDAEDDEKDENYESIKNKFRKDADPLYRFAGLKLADMTAGTIPTESNASTNGDDKEENRIVDTINEVYSFGRNESGMLGMEDNRGRLRPSPINFCGVVELTRVSKVSCSWYHSVALTDVGLLYSWGDGADGALGHRNRDNVLQPRLVEWFTEQMVAAKDIHLDDDDLDENDEAGQEEAMGKRGIDPILLIDVACGADKIGAHTVACSTRGRVYAWGAAGATGHRITVSITAPRIIDHPNVIRSKIKSVAAGGSFCLGLSMKGSVFSWGRFANGRLGHGILPSARRQKIRSLSRRQVPRFLLFPKRIDRLKGTRISSICAGESHAHAVDEDGNLYSWGSARCGQLGLGETGDQLFPVKVEEFRIENGALITDDDVVIKHVCAGATHSMAVTVEGDLYTWGGNGGAMLGLSADHHGDTAVVRSSGALVKASRYIDDAEDDEGASNEKLREESAWLRPRLVTMFNGSQKKIVDISAGVEHSVCLSSDGMAYIWGGGLDNDVDLFAENVNVGTAKALGVLGDGKLRSIEPEPTLLEAAEVDGVAQKNIRAISCGGWHTVLVTQGTHLGNQMRKPMKAGMGVKAEIGTFASDLTIAISGYNFHVHKLILSSRSKYFKELIEKEERDAADSIMADEKLTKAMKGKKDDDDEDSESVITVNDIGPIQLLLSEMDPRLVIRLLEYIYTDTVRGRLDPTSYEVKDLLVLADQFFLPRLRQICESAMAGKLGALQSQEDGSVLRVPLTVSSQLGKDLGKYINARRFADICFIVQGRPLYAHSVILMSASKYFEKMLGPICNKPTPLKEMEKYGRRLKDDMIEIEVPDTYDLFLIVLAFMYTGNIVKPDNLKSIGSNSNTKKPMKDINTAKNEKRTVYDPIEVLGILIAGKRYGLRRLVTLCENFCLPTMDTCLNILKESDRLNVSGLRDRCLTYVATNMDELKDSAEFSMLKISSPRLLEKILIRVREIDRSRDWNVNRQMSARRIIDAEVLEEVERKQKIEEDKKTEPFPWVAIISILVGFAAFFVTMANLRSEIMWVIPFVNIAGVAAILLVVFRALSN